MDQLILDHFDCFQAAQAMARYMLADDPEKCYIYGVPRGGVPVAYLLTAADSRIMPLCNADALLLQNRNGIDLPFAGGRNKAYIVDDVVDSGATKERWEKKTELEFLSLTDFLTIKKKEPGQWIVFPWETGETGTSEEEIVLRLLQYIGEDPKREGLVETPRRVLKAWKHFTQGYHEDPATILKCFTEKKYDEMIIEKDLPFYSTCEHHMVPFFGTATIAYIPEGKVVGLSKLPRVLNVFARRLQMQERLTAEVADAIMEHLKPKGVGVLTRARHLCMECRGVAIQGHHTVMSALRGNFLSDATVRAEFLNLATK